MCAVFESNRVQGHLLHYIVQCQSSKEAQVLVVSQPLLRRPKGDPAWFDEDC